MFHELFVSSILCVGSGGRAGQTQEPLMDVTMTMINVEEGEIIGNKFGVEDRTSRNR